jgi:hypothetical protein
VKFVLVIKSTRPDGSQNSEKRLRHVTQLLLGMISAIATLIKMKRAEKHTSFLFLQTDLPGARLEKVRPNRPRQQFIDWPRTGVTPYFKAGRRRLDVTLSTRQAIQQ